MTSTFCMEKMTVTRIVLFWMFASSNALFASLFKAPDGLSPSPERNISGTKIELLEQYSTSDRLVQVTAMTYPAITSHSQADEFIAGIISGMKNKGFKDETVEESKYGDFERRIIRGEFSSSEYEGVFVVRTDVVFSSANVFSLSSSIHNSSDFDLASEALLDRLSISGSAIKLGMIPSPSANYIAEKIGYVIGLALPFLAVFLVARRLTRKKTAEQDIVPNP